MEKFLRRVFCVDTEGAELKAWAAGAADGDAELSGLMARGGDGAGAGGYGTMSNFAGNKKVCVPQKIDPKTFFANERTFLKWLSISTMVGAMSVALLGFADATSDGAQLAGIILLPVSILFMVYALAVFRRRAHCIYMREPIRYDDTRGPTLLVVILAVALIMSTYFSLRRAVPAWHQQAAAAAVNGKHHGGSNLGSVLGV